MPQYSILEPEKRPDESDRAEPSDYRQLLTLCGVIVAILGGVLALVMAFRMMPASRQRHGSGVKAASAEAARYAPETLRSHLLSYLAQPRFAGRDFEQQLLGAVRLELYQLDDREVYFSLPAGEPAQQRIGQAAARFMTDPARIEIAREEEGRLWLGRYSIPKGAERGLFFKTSVENIRFDSESPLSFQFQRATYTLRLPELADFITSRSVYGGKLNPLDRTRRVSFINHGVMVARPGEPSLKRLGEDLTKDIPADDPMAREKRIQRLLDFVSQEIAYDQTEALASAETLKRPNETLMSHRTDCSNKAILLGSLLEQAGEDYLFLYCPKHITVAVPRGKFENRNGLAFDWEGQTWLVAESTASGFQIGVSHLTKEAIFKQVRYVQRPGQKNLIYDAVTLSPLEFR
ncbi:MAG TPA: hypothetical protein VFD58_36185 [Blastocatellia bacterium]|nr:hypothetical protein [Blastocatellia bacterium]